MPVTSDYFVNKKLGGNVAAHCVLYRGDNQEGVNQFDSFQTVVRKAIDRLKKIEEKVKYLQSIAP